MPQSISVRLHKVITLPITDLATVSMSNQDNAEIYMKNTGPGKVYVSFDATKPANSTTPADNVFLAVGDSITFKKVVRNTQFTLMADTASTVLTLTQT